MATHPRTSTTRRSRAWLALLLLVPFIVLLWPPFYNADRARDHAEAAEAARDRLT